MAAIPFFWRAQRLANQIGVAMSVQIPQHARPGRLGALRLRRHLDQIRASGQQGLIAVDLDGYAHPVWVRAGSSDLDVLQQLMVHHELGFSLDREPRWIIDVGANIGLSALYFARRFPSARILAVEVESANHELLVRNAAPYPLITPIHKAIWCKSGHVRISNPEAQAWSFRVEMATPETRDALEAISMNDLMDEHGVDSADLVKMDIEGAEREVLSEGLHPWLGRTAVLAVELHERHRKGCEASLDRAAASATHDREIVGEYHIVRFHNR